MERRLDLALAVLFLTVVAPIVPWLTAHESSRYAFTAALAEQSRFEVDDYESLLSTDVVRHDGHVYSDKAPGQPVLAVPVLTVAGWLGAEPGTELRRTGNLGAWSLSLAFCAIPGAVLLVLMRRHAARTEPRRWSALAAFGLAFGTLLLPMSSALYAHVFVGMLGFGAWHLLSDPEDRGLGRLLGAAVLSSVAVASEYPMVWVAAVLTVYIIVRHGWRRASIFIAPHLLAVSLVIAHSLRVYDRIGTGYSAKDRDLGDSFGIPNPAHMLRIFFAEKGFSFTPIVIVGVVGLVQLLRRGRRDVLVPTLVVAGFLLLQSGWVNPWGGETAGPRYMIPSLPFLAVATAAMLPAIGPRFRYAIVATGMVSMGLVLVTMPLVLTDETLIIGHLRNIDRFGLNPTLFTMAIGPAGWVVHLGLVALAVLVVRRSWPTAVPPTSRSDAGLARTG